MLLLHIVALDFIHLSPEENAVKMKDEKHFGLGKDTDRREKGG